MRLLLATEANEGMGHIAPWAEFVAQALQQGIEVHMAAPNPAQLDQLLGKYVGMNVWQAPTVRLVLPAGPILPKSWPELLVSLGYGDSERLTGAVKAWINLLKSLAPDVVLADYAPALMLAAKIVGIPSIEIGSGFCVPPLLNGPHVLPGVRSANQHDLALAPDALKRSFNAAFKACGSDQYLSCFSDMVYWPVQRVVTSPPELDHYGVRRDVLYCGFLGGHDTHSLGAQSQSLLNESPNVIGYLKFATPGLEALIKQMQEASINAHLVIPDCNDAMAGQRGSVCVSRTLVDLPIAMQQADVYLSNGGLHGVGQALHAGCWPVVVPMQAEQVAMARQLILRKWGDLWIDDTTAKLQRPLRNWFDVKNCTSPFLASANSAEKMLVALIKTSKKGDLE